MYADLTCSVHIVNNFHFFCNYQTHVCLCIWGPYVRMTFEPNMLSSWNKVIIFKTWSLPFYKSVRLNGFWTKSTENILYMYTHFNQLRASSYMWSIAGLEPGQIVPSSPSTIGAPFYVAFYESFLAKPSNKNTKNDAFWFAYLFFVCPAPWLWSLYHSTCIILFNWPNTINKTDAQLFEFTSVAFDTGYNWGVFCVRYEMKGDGKLWPNTGANECILQPKKSRMNS